ncbi:cyclic-phosphate processing receiver domain-containing protein [Nocardioides litoris]|uniref:cyclic-phosphate processing receiver domain-containing protein n=1 Tax=Nocardioides litoris TaxID=1926648 RepID=UPI001477814C|nr:cyclic-phosphate processing receiver domain-containing protein [Nocardioides litoris]
MRLWIDDLRPAPEGWRWAKTSREAIAILEAQPADAVSFDHDLGRDRDGDDTTRAVVLWMCEHDRWPPTVHVHTANPVGREWLVGMARRYGPGVTHRA